MWKPCISVAFGLLMVLATDLPAAEKNAPAKLKALIIDGRNNHNWRATTPVLKKALEASARFTVRVATCKKYTAPFGFADFDVLVMNYNTMGEVWPKGTRDEFEKYVTGGGGLVIYHAANNSFEKWPAYNEMIGLGWRNNKFGDRITIGEDGKIVRTPKGQGPGAGHGAKHEYSVVARDKEHPVTKGLPGVWMHIKDELYHAQRGPAKNLTILASAFSAKDKGGTGDHEPVLWVVPYGKGRVFTTVLGHGASATNCVGAIVTFQRGTEWAATGQVTISVPEDFPTPEKSAKRDY